MYYQRAVNFRWYYLKPHLQSISLLLGKLTSDTMQNNIDSPIESQIGAYPSQQGTFRMVEKGQEYVPSPISPASQVNSFSAIFEARIQNALDLKSQGNIEFKAKRYETAKNFYQQALGNLQPNAFYGAPEAQRVKMAELSSNLLFNIGSCFFNQNLWKESELIYNEAIIVNPNYVKAIYKRALALYEMGQIEKAMADIKYAFSLDKTNKQIHESYEKILLKYNEVCKIYKEKSKELSSKIFSSQKLQEKTVKQEMEKEQKEEDEPKKGSWWMLTPLLLPLAAIGIYQGIKLLRS